MLLESIHCPEDLKKLSRKECTALAQEIRERIVGVVSHNGGHLASNLGVVELTLALHRVFTTPTDSFVWDVGHQCYTHKILTGRNGDLESIRRKGGLSGFPKTTESEHDAVSTGHSSTSISAALGILEGNRLMGKSGKAVAIIGDGALTGGMAFEALNHAGHLKKDLVVVLNDNDMSISRNVGALSSQPRQGKISATISRMVMRPFYQTPRRFIDSIYSKLPNSLSFLKKARFRFKKAMKAFLLQESIFGELGFSYVGPIDGHNVALMERVFKRIKKLKMPVVVHVKTQKGKGYPYAEGDPTSFHGVGAFNVIDGKVDKKSNLSFCECFSSIIVDAAKENPNLVAVSAAMIEGTGLSAFATLYPEKTYDVGIAEQHAVTFAAGMAREGALPVVAIYSTFMQRAVDQVIHDVALPNLPVVFVMSRSGFVPDDGETHQGLFDIPLFRSIPNLQLISPSGALDYKLLFEYAIKQKSPVLIRVPKALCSFSSLLNQPVEMGRGIFLHRKKNPTLLVSLGGVFDEVEEAVNRLARESVLVDHYNLRFAKPLNREKLMSDFSGYKNILFFEDGAIEGGVGEKLSTYFVGVGETQFEHYGAADEFFAQASRGELLASAQMDSDSIVKKVLGRLAR